MIEQARLELEAFDLAAAIRTIYAFTWDEFCDWYIEAAKPSLKAGNPATQEVLKHTLESILKLLAPFMPFITSEIFAALNPTAEQLSFLEFPTAKPDTQDAAALREFGTVKDAISLVRSLRSELNLSPAQTIKVSVAGEGLAAVNNNLETFKALAKAEIGHLEGKTLASVAPGLEVRVAFEGLVDENDWLEKAKKRAIEFEKQITQAKAKLSNEGFVARAPSDVIEEENRRVVDFGAQLERLKVVLEQF